MISFDINEKEISIEPPKKEVDLLDYLRNTLNLTGSKFGCQDRSCGSCVVLIDGKAVRACGTDISKLDGKKITTIERLEQDGKLDPIQEAFIETNSVQCGFCTPGLIMSAKGLLLKNDNPSDHDINKALRKNLCRCGTYPRLADAVKRSAAVIRGEAVAPYLGEPVTEETVIGKSVPRIDIRDKVTGGTQFYEDYTFENTMHGKIVWSKYPHAEIVSIDTKNAETIPGVQLVLTAKDIPGENAMGLTKDQPVLAADKVRYLGDPVAVVFADDEETAQAGVDAVIVEYKQLPEIFSIEDALAPDAPLVHDRVATRAQESDGGTSKCGREILSSDSDSSEPEICHGNIYYQNSMRRGNIEAAFAEADIVLEREYSTPYQEHAFIEVEGCISRIDDEGKVVLYTPTQLPFFDRYDLSSVLNLAEEDIKLIHTPAGGAFGGKADFTIHAHAAIASMKTGRPTRIVLTREESLLYHYKRHMFEMKYKIAARKDGKILAMDIDLKTDGGAYESWNVMPGAIAFSTGPYYVPNFNIHGMCVYSNNPVGGAFRGYGVPQVAFAVESLLDELSAKLHIDPITLREMNAVDVGMPIAAGELLKTGSVAFKQTLAEIRKALHEELEPLKMNGKNVGIGIASGYRYNSDGLGHKPTTGAILELENDGKITMKVEMGEIGQGTQTSLCQLVAEFFGISVNDINVIGGDTSQVPSGDGQQASHGLFLTGLGVMKASEKLRDLMLEHAAIILNSEQDSLHITGGIIVDRVNPAKQLSFADLAKSKNWKLGVEEYVELPETYALSRDANESGAINPEKFRNFPAVSFTTAAVAVAVDEKAGTVEVLNTIMVLDCGKIINPELARTQAEGCLIQALGWALSEEFVAEKGVIKTNTLGKVKIPRMNETPDKISTIFVEVEDPYGPLGAKGIGEIPFLPIAPAVTNAINDAIGKRVTKLPALKYLKESI